MLLLRILLFLAWMAATIVVPAVILVEWPVIIGGYAGPTALAVLIVMVRLSFRVCGWVVEP